MSPAPPYLDFFHPTDFSEPCLMAFYHALAMTVACRGELTVFHSGYPSEPFRQERWPRVRPILTRWGMLAPGATREDVGALGITVKKRQTSGLDTVAGIAKQAVRDESDLLIMATHARSGLARLVHKEIAAPTLRRVQRPALLFPGECRGFLDLETGRPRLERVLIAVDHQPSAEPALRAVARLLATFGPSEGVCREVHVGSTPPLSARPEIPGWSWEQRTVQGHPDERLMAEAEEWKADLIALVSRGRDHLVDAFLGSTLDHVLSASACPVLAVPV